jgi:Ca2+-binding RTX toxin-like protein
VTDNNTGDQSPEISSNNLVWLSAGSPVSFEFDLVSTTLPLWSSVTTTLPADVNDLTLTGADNINGFGNSLNNTLTGNEANNLLFGKSGDDTLYGGNGNDRLVGGKGSDILLGGGGDDILNGKGYSQAIDILTGGSGADTFVLGNHRLYYRGSGYATITDFDSSQDDKIQVLGDSTQYQLGQLENAATGMDTGIFYVGNGGNNLIGVVQGSLDVSLEQHFVFV